MNEPYNPLDKLNLGRSVVDALLESDLHSIRQLPTIVGAGIYALYYAGDFPAYSPIVGETVPIYIGKAVPTGARKGASLVSSGRGRALAGRLAQHRDSIEAAGNLSVDDFAIRYLTVDDIWIPLAEALLISMFSPVWNLVIEGFGNHDPGAGRYQGLRPMWDVVHPGRAWAARCKSRGETSDELCRKASTFLSNKRS
jgi:hypothetical protein